MEQTIYRILPSRLGIEIRSTIGPRVCGAFLVMNVSLQRNKHLGWMS